MKQVATAFGAWADENDHRYPMRVYTNASGAPRFADATNAFRYFQVMSNGLVSPRNLVCPVDPKRTVATNFGSGFSNQNVSYFVGLDADESNPDMFLAGDRNLSSGSPLQAGVLVVNTNHALSWTPGFHWGGGNVALTDGSVEQLNDVRLNDAIRQAGGTNRLLMPVWP